MFGQQEENNSSDTSLTINKHSFRIKTTDINKESILLTVTCDLKTILADTLIEDGYNGIDFIDLNKDKNLDILTSYIGNNGIYFLYLFDPASNTFKNLDGFEKYPDAVQLKTNGKYYYSYHRAGCADANWVSDLFTIKDFKTIQIGHIYGQGCDSDIKEDPQVIEIYKVINDDEGKGELIEKLPYLKNIPVFGAKWNFIEKYWNKNFTKFE